ncbi:MAG: addiction module toxin, HicA family [bacterium]|nr:addiction module toxin, HicA family [bacterium]
MPRLPTVDFRTLDRLLRSLGFEIVRQKGGHVFYRHPVAGQQLPSTIKVVIWQDPCCVSSSL